MNDRFGQRINPDYLDDLAGVSRQVFRNWRTLENGSLSSCVWLSSRVDRLYRELLATPEFRNKVQQTEGLRAGCRPYHWISFLEHNNCRSGLLYLPRGGQIGMHDHAGSIGVSIVLQGTPLISQCDRVSECGDVLTPVAEEKISRRRLQPQQKSFIFPHKNNIHGFSSAGSSSLLLNTVFHQQALHHHSFLPGQLINRSLSRQHLASTLYQSLLKILLSISLALSASVYAGDASLPAHTAATAQAAMPFDALERVALAGDAHAQAGLAERYSSGHGVEKDLFRASIWYRRAAESGCAEAQYQIGVMLLEGEGMTEDSVEGLEWIFRASQADHAKATGVFNYLMANPAGLDC